MVRVELKGYQEALGVWDEKPVRKAAASAIKKAAASAFSSASTRIRAVYNIKKNDLDSRIKITPPGPNDLFAVITVNGRGLSLSYFGARQTVINKVITRSKAGLKTKTMKRSAKFQGVQVEVEKGKKTQLKSAFLAQMKSGHIGVMRRDPNKIMKSRQKYGNTKHAQALVEKQVVSVASMIRKANVESPVLTDVQAAWDRIFPQELNFQLNVKGQTP